MHFLPLLSSLPLVVNRWAHVVFALFVFAGVYWCFTHIVLWFFLHLVYTMLTVSLIVPSVFSNIYLVHFQSKISWNQIIKLHKKLFIETININEQTITEYGGPISESVFMTHLKLGKENLPSLLNSTNNCTAEPNLTMSGYHEILYGWWQ
jgi:hypothetical protein